MLFDEKNIEPLKKFLLSKAETIAVAESVTSGLLQFSMSLASDALKFYQGGITAYNLGQKTRHLSIDPIHASECNCVSQEVAEEMALNICRLFNSDWGIGITGYASPCPESNNKIFAYYAVSHNGEVIIRDKIEPKATDPLHVQTFYAQEVLKTCNQYVSKLNEKFVSSIMRN